MHAVSRHLLFAALCLALAACGAVAQPSPAATPGQSGAPAQSDAPAPPAATPALTPVLPGTDPGPSLAPGEAEAALLHGMRLDLQGACVPLRDDLPAGAAGAVACVPAGDVAARVTVVVFETREAMLDAYQARLDAEGITRDANGSCQPGQPSEGGYVPGPGVQERGACWIDQDGVAHYVATSPPFTLLGVDGRPGSASSAVWQFAWLGNRDQPGGPTLWAEEPLSPEK